MVRFLKSFAVLASLALLVTAAAVPALRAADAQTGSIKGTLVDADGKAFAGSAKVDLVAFHEKHTQAAGQRTAPIQSVKITADDKGVYTFKDVPAGKYSIRASSKELKVGGHSTAAVVVEAGKETTADPITLKPKAPKN